MDEVKVGAETEAWCTSCKLMKDHIIVAMSGTKPAKVECIGCGKQHLYRPRPPGAAKPRTGRSHAVKVRTPQPADLDARIASKEARTYTPSEKYVIDDVVTHPTFGKGLVIALPAHQKMEVAFSSGRKLLVHERGGVREGNLAPPTNRPHEFPPETQLATDAPIASADGTGETPGGDGVG